MDILLLHCNYQTPLGVGGKLSDINLNFFYYPIRYLCKLKAEYQTAKLFSYPPKSKIRLCSMSDVEMLNQRIFFYRSSYYFLYQLISVAIILLYTSLLLFIV